MRVKKEAEARERADEVATAVGEFLGGLEYEHLIAIAEEEDV